MKRKFLSAVLSVTLAVSLFGNTVFASELGIGSTDIPEVTVETEEYSGASEETSEVNEESGEESEESREEYSEVNEDTVESANVKAEPKEYIHTDGSVWVNYKWGYAENHPVVKFVNKNQEVVITINLDNDIFGTRTESKDVTGFAYITDQSGERKQFSYFSFVNGKGEARVSINNLDENKVYELTTSIRGTFTEFIVHNNEAYFGSTLKKNNAENRKAYYEFMETLGKAGKGDYIKEYLNAPQFNVDKKAYAFAKELVAACKDEYEIVKTISAWIYENIVYDVSSFEWNAEGADEVLDKMNGKCHEHTLLLRAMLNAVNIPCIYVSSITDNHAWNMACVDGKWCSIDSTNAGFSDNAYINIASYTWTDIRAELIPDTWVSIPFISKSGDKLLIIPTTPGSTIYYTTDGSTPTMANGVKVSGSSATVDTFSGHLKAIAVKNGYASGVAKLTLLNATKERNVSFGVKGAFGGRNVTFNSDLKGAKIYYSAATSTLTTKDKCVDVGETVLFEDFYGTIYARTYKDGQWGNVCRLILKIPTVNTPSITSAGNGKVKITTTTPNCIIYYTTDGSTPSPTNGRRVSSSSTVISVGAGKTVKAIAVRSCFTNSKVVTYK